MPAWQTTDLNNFEYMSGGYSNRNFSFEHSVSGETEKYVLRSPQGQQPFVDRAAEQAFYGQLPRHIGADLVAFNVETGQMITRWIEGPTLAEVFTDQFHEDDLVQYVKRLHSLLPATPKTYDVVAQAAMLSQATLLDVEDAADASLLAPCHNDLNPWNVIVTELGWKTLDWEFVGLNDPLFDLVALHQGLELPPDNLIQLTESFINGKDEARLVSNLTRFWAREFAWADYQLAHGNDREEIRQQLITAQTRLKSL